VAAGKPLAMSRGGRPRLGWLTKPSLTWAAAARHRPAAPRYDGPVSTPPPPEPGERRPAGSEPRRLDRPPGERYATREAIADEAPAPKSPIRGIVLASGVGTIGSAASIALFALASISAGLLVVAGLTGLFVAEALRAGASARIPARLRRTLAVALGVESVAVAQLGIWLYARAEGGALGIIDYLAQTFGPLVPLQFAIAALVAWWRAR
jgi:hypothetical protein